MLEREGLATQLSTFKKHWPERQLLESKVILRTYSGEKLSVEGKVDVEVRYKGQQFTLHLYIIDGCGPTLFGHNWMKVILLDWLELHAIRSDSTVETLIAKHIQLFQPGLGTLRGFKLHLHVDSTVKPVYSFKSCLSSVLAPLYNLLKADCHRRWHKEEQREACI